MTDLAHKRLYTVDEAAIYLGRTACAIREMIWAGKLPVVRSDRRVFIDLKDLSAFVRRNKFGEGDG